MVEVAISSTFGPPAFGPGGNPDGHGYSSGRQMSGMFKVLEKTGDISQVARSGAEDLATLGLEYFDWSTIIPYSYDNVNGIWTNGGRTLEELSDPDEVGGDRVQRIIDVQNRMNVDSSIKQAVVSSEDFGDGRSYFYLLTRDSTDSNKISGLAIEYQGTIAEFNKALQLLNNKRNDHSKKANIGFDTPLFFREGNKIEVSDILDASLGSYRNTQRRIEMKPYIDKLKTDVADFPALVSRHEKRVAELTHTFQNEMLTRPDVVVGLSAAVHGMNRIAEDWIEQNQTQYQSRLGIPKQNVPAWEIDATPTYDYVSANPGDLTTTEIAQDSQRNYELREQREETILAAYQRETDEEDDKVKIIPKPSNLKKKRVKQETSTAKSAPEKVVEGSVAKNLKQENREDTVGVDTTITAVIALVKQIAFSSQTNSQSIEIPASSRDPQVEGSIKHEFLMEIVAPVVPVLIYQIEGVISSTQKFVEQDDSKQISVSQNIETVTQEKKEEQTSALLVGLTILQLAQDLSEVNSGQPEVTTVFLTEKPEQTLITENEIKEIVAPAIIYLVNTISEEEKEKSNEAFSIESVKYRLDETSQPQEESIRPIEFTERAIHQKIEEQTTTLLVGLSLLQLWQKSQETNTLQQDISSLKTAEKSELPIRVENETREIITPAIIYLINAVDVGEEAKSIPDATADSNSTWPQVEKADYGEVTINEVMYGLEETFTLFHTLAEIEEALDLEESGINKEDRDIVKGIQLELQEDSMVVVPAFLALADQLSTTNRENLEEQIINPISSKELFGSNVEDMLILDSEEFSAIWQEVFELMFEGEVTTKSNEDEKKETVDELIHRSDNKGQKLEMITEQLQQAIDLIVNSPISIELEDYERDHEVPEVFQETVDLSKKLLDVVTQTPLQGELPKNETNLAKLFILIKLFEKEKISQDERKLLIALMYQQIKQINTNREQRDVFDLFSSEITQLIASSQPLEQKLAEVEGRLDTLMESESGELFPSITDGDSDLLDKLIFLVNIKKNSNIAPIQIEHPDRIKVADFYEMVIQITNNIPDEELRKTDNNSKRDEREINVMRQKVLSLLLLEAQQNRIGQKELLIANELLAKEPDYIQILIPKLLVELDYQHQQIWKILKLLQIKIDKLGNFSKIDSKRSRKTPIELEGMLFERFKLRRKRTGSLNIKATFAHFGVIYQYYPLVMEAVFMTQ